MRSKLKKYYENLIDDIEDEEVREEMLDRLEAIDDEIFELDYDIRARIENQECRELPTAYEQDVEFMYANRMC